MDPAICRFCLDEATTDENPFIQPCNCKGSIEHVHLQCLLRWIFSSPRHNDSCNMCLYHYIYTIPQLEDGSLAPHPVLYYTTSTPIAGVATIFFGPLIAYIDLATFVQVVQGLVLLYYIWRVVASTKSRGLYIYYYFKSWSIHVLSLIATATVINRTTDANIVCLYYFLNCCIFYTHTHIDYSIRTRINARILRRILN
jgi:hypothetical protein